MKRGLAVVVVALALVAGACGNGGEGPGGSASGDLPLLPASAAGGGGGAGRDDAVLAEGTSAAACAHPAGAEPAPCDDTGPSRRVEYRLADDIDPMGGTAAAYRLDVDVDERQVMALARAFEVEGRPREQNGTWTVGGERSGGRTLHVGPDGSFNLYDERAHSVASGSSSGSCTSEGVCTETPPSSAPYAADLPSDAEAERKARQLLGDAGVGLDDATARVDRSDHSVAVAFSFALGGREVEGWGAAVAFGSGGAVQYANASLAKASKVGEYPLAETAAAWERSGMGKAGEVHTMMAEDTSSQDEPGSSQSQPTSESPPSTLPPEVRELDRVELVLTVQYGRCPGDTVHLVPGYRLSVGDETFTTIVAVADGHLQSSSQADASDSYEPCPGQDGRTEPGREPEDSPPATI